MGDGLPKITNTTSLVSQDSCTWPMCTKESCLPLLQHSAHCHHYRWQEPSLQLLSVHLQPANPSCQQEKIQSMCSLKSYFEEWHRHGVWYENQPVRGEGEMPPGAGHPRCIRLLTSSCAMGAEQGPVLHSSKAALSLPPPRLVLASPCHWCPCGCQQIQGAMCCRLAQLLQQKAPG